MPKATGERCGKTFRAGNSLAYIVWVEAAIIGNIVCDEELTLKVHTGAHPIPSDKAVRRLLQ